MNFGIIVELEKEEIKKRNEQKRLSRSRGKPGIA